MSSEKSWQEQLKEFSRGAAKIVTADELSAKLQEERPLRVKLGVDPTAPDIHLGHAVALSKLRQFQDNGHQAVLIIGDFTAMVGDPSGRSATRPQLTHEEVLANAKTYQEQAFKVLDPDRTEVVFNGDWFRSMNYGEVIRLNSRVTLQQMLQREDFRTRMEKSHPVCAHELQYPIMQGWDSVMVRSDVELGGTDQLFNVLVGRDLQAGEGQSKQVAILLPILVGTDGTAKMSKSLGNAIGVNEPAGEMFGKLMSLPDEAMADYFELLLQEEFPAGAHPMETKKNLAFRLVERFHSRVAAREALSDFTTRFSTRDLEAAELPVFPATRLGADVVSIVIDAYQLCFGISKTRSEARRLIEQGSVRWKGEKIADLKAVISAEETGVLKLDKTRAVRVG